MPVWHERTRAARESGRLKVVGLIQEQHPERCRLWARWQEVDWPILWDPFNRTGSRVVPNVVAVDEHGIVRAIDPDPETFAADFLEATFEEPAVRAVAAPLRAEDDVVARALARLSRPAEAAPDEHVEVLVARAAAQPTDAVARFRAGVALRMRYDAGDARPDDFQRAVDHWTAALALDPNQYIWRRRIQQYGPRMDKPYDFYGWIARARAELVARGEEPFPLTVDLTPAELASPRRSLEELPADEPDPDARITRDDGLIRVESAVAFATGEDRTSATLHLALRPDAARDAHWNNEAGPLAIWIATDGLPTGWRLEQRLVTVAPGGPAVSDEVRRFTVELELPPDAEPATLSAYVLFYACEGRDGTCVYRRHDFRVPVTPIH